MKKRACIVSGLAALAALFLAPLAEASLTRPSNPARETPALSLTLAAPEPSEFSLFDGTEIARALASRPAFDLISITTDDAATAGRARFVSPPELSADELPSDAPELLPITAVREQRFNLRIPPDVFGLEPLRGPPGDEASYPKTRYRVFGLLGTPILGELRGVSLGLRWGCASFSCGLASGTVGWLSQDPLEDRDSPNLYGFVGARPHEKTDPLGLAVSYARNGTIVISDERTAQGQTYKVSSQWAETHPDEFLHLLSDVGGLGREGAGAFLSEHQLAPTGDAARQALARQITRDTDELLREVKKEWLEQAKWGVVGVGAAKAIGLGAKVLGETRVGQFLARDIKTFLPTEPPRISVAPAEYGSLGSETLDDSFRMTDQPFFNKRSRLRQNKSMGDAFRDEIAEAFRREGRLVETEVEKDTLFGSRYIDIEVSDAEGNVLGGVETKVGKSRYHSSQRAKDELLKRLDPPYPVIVIRKE